MAGSGELSKTRAANYFVYNKSMPIKSKFTFFLVYFLLIKIDTPLQELEDAVRSFLNRDDIAVLLIVQYVADLIRHIIDNYEKTTPAILEIPSKEHAYDPSKDYILKRAQVINHLYSFPLYFAFL